MDRYIAALPIRDNDTRKLRLQTTALKQINVSAGDVYIKTTSVERLDKLAYFFYKDATYWPIIADANSIGKGTLMVAPNTNLRIPNPNTINTIINNIINE